MHGKYLENIFRPLGKLNFIRIWHDNSGIGDYASWFLGAIIVKDMQKGKKFSFINNRWLAVELEDGDVSSGFSWIISE